MPDSPRGCVESTPFAFCFPAEYRSLGIQITCICRDDSLLRCCICCICCRRSGCCRMGIVAGGGQIICTVVAHGRAGAGTAGQQTALGAVAALHNASGTGECLIRHSPVPLALWSAATAPRAVCWPAVPAPARPWATTVQMICPPPATIPMRQHPLRLQQMQQMQHRSRLSSRQIQVIWIPSDLYSAGKQNAKGVLSTQPRGESGKETPYFTQQNWVI